jgi:thymidylate synthase
MRQGVETLPIQGEKARMVIGPQMRFNFDNGFPLITERDLSGKFITGALGEHIGFLHGARTHEELTKWGCPWWKKWVTKEKCDIFGLAEGDLGPGSYGPGWTATPTPEGAAFNQIENVIKQLKERPALRTHLITPWYPPYVIQHSARKRKVVVAPCHGWLHILAFPETKELSVHHWQRSGDVPVGVAFNIIQYASFTMMVAKTLGYKPKELIYTISDAHIYERQYPFVEKLLEREPRAFPTMTLEPSITEVLDFRPEHFKISDYHPHEAMVIPTPV